MSIFRKTMKALGFSGEDDEFEAQPYTAENITNILLPAASLLRSAPSAE